MTTVHRNCTVKLKFQNQGTVNNIFTETILFLKMLGLVIRQVVYDLRYNSTDIWKIRRKNTETHATLRSGVHLGSHSFEEGQEY